MYYNLKFKEDLNYVFEASLVNMLMYKLLTNEEYSRLVETENIENIYSSLGERGYNTSSKEIDFFKEESNLLSNIIKFSKNEVLTEYYRIQYDIFNLKTVYKALLKGEPFESLRLYSNGTLSSEALRLIYNDEYKSYLHPDLMEGVKYFEKNLQDNTPFDIDITWDKYLNIFFLKKSKELDNDFMTKFHQLKIEIQNIMTLFRLKMFNKDYKTLQKSLIPSEKDYSYLFLKLYKEDLDIIVSKLSFLDISSYLRRGYEEYKRKGSLTFLENQLYSLLYDEYLSLASNRIFGYDIIFAYFWRKKREIEKVRLLLAAKTNNMSKLFLEKIRG